MHKPGSWSYFQSSHSSLRENQLDVACWTSLSEALEQVTSLTSLNGCDQYAAIRDGGLAEIKLLKEWELGIWAARFLGRSASSLTKLDLRCEGCETGKQHALHCAIAGWGGWLGKFLPNIAL